MTLIDFYENLLATLWLKADEDGVVSRITELDTDVYEVLYLDGKPVVLPTPTQLRARGLTDKYLFNPMTEDALSRESDVISRIRNLGSIRLSTASIYLLNSLVAIAVAKEQHRLIPARHAEVLSILKDVDDNSMVAMSRLTTAAAKQNGIGKSVWSTYMKHGGELGGKKYSRVAVVTSPLYSELSEKREKYFGVTMRVKDVAMFKKLMEYVFPKLLDEDGYSMGSHDNTAPYLHALLSAFHGVAADINVVEKKLGEHMPDAKLIAIPMDWVDAMSEYEDFRKELRAIPTQNSTRGTKKVEEAIKESRNMLGDALSEVTKAQHKVDEARNELAKAKAVASPPWEEPAAPLVPQTLTPQLTSSPTPHAVANNQSFFGAPAPAPAPVHHSATGTMSMSAFLGPQALQPQQTYQPQGRAQIGGFGNRQGGGMFGNGSSGLF